MPRRRRPALAVDAAASSEGEDGLVARPEQRHAANARERARMRVLARAFCRLKTTLPWVPADTKLSKLDTLRLAASYIAHLRAILTDQPAPPSAQHPLNLTWPFSFQQTGGGSSSSGAAATFQQPPGTAGARGSAGLPTSTAAGDWGGATAAERGVGSCAATLATHQASPPSPADSSCSGDADGDLDDDECDLYQPQHHLHHIQHHLPYANTLMHLG